MEILGYILSLLGGVLTEVLKWALSTPSKEEKIEVQEGKARPIDDSDYDGLYGSSGMLCGNQGTP